MSFQGSDDANERHRNWTAFPWALTLRLFVELRDVSEPVLTLGNIPMCVGRTPRQDQLQRDFTSSLDLLCSCSVKLVPAMCTPE